MRKVTMLITHNGYQYTTLTPQMAREFGATKYQYGVDIANDSLAKLIKVNKSARFGTVYTLLQDKKHFIIGASGCEVSEFN